MVKALLLTFFVFFAVVGICEILYIIKMLFYYPGTRFSSYIIIVLKKGNSIKQLNYLWQKLKWHGDSYASGIIAVCDYIDNEERHNCVKFIEGKNIKLCDYNSVFECMQFKGS